MFSCAISCLSGLTEAQGSIPFANEHIQNVLKQDILFRLHRSGSTDPSILEGNGTLIPDHIFDNMQPVILVRHPIYQVNSTRGMADVVNMGPSDEDFECLCSLALHRTVFELFRQKGLTPVVVDAEDILWRTRKMTENLSDSLGLDATQFSEIWETWPEDQQDPSPLIQAFVQTIYASTGIERPAEMVRLYIVYGSIR
jgi:hypothetical protein